MKMRTAAGLLMLGFSSQVLSQSNSFDCSATANEPTIAKYQRFQDSDIQGIVRAASTVSPRQQVERSLGIAAGDRNRLRALLREQIGSNTAKRDTAARNYCAAATDCNTGGFPSGWPSSIPDNIFRNSTSGSGSVSFHSAKLWLMHSMLVELDSRTLRAVDCN